VANVIRFLLGNQMNLIIIRRLPEHLRLARRITSVRSLNRHLLFKPSS